MAIDLVESPFINTESNTSTQCASDGVLTGLSVAVKDLFHIAGIPTTAGNPDWLTTHATPKSTNSAVQALLNAGASYRGKTITDELAYSLNGQNIHYGTPKNPLTPDRLPGGSSSGSAVAVSAGLADIGLGTDTGGSIRVPSSYNGLFGIRPTHNAISCDNMVPLAPSFDTVGWMTTSLTVLKAVADVLLPPCASQERAVRIGAAQTLINHVEHGKQINQWLADTAMSNVAVDIDLNALGTANAFRVLQGAEIWAQHGDWLTNNSTTIASDIKVRFDWCATISQEDIAQARQDQQTVIDYMATLFTDVDVIVLPTTPGLSPLLSTEADQLADYRNHLLSMTALAGLCGLPQLHLPLFTLNGAPCGVSLLGPKGSDHTLISVATRLLDNNNDK